MYMLLPAGSAFAMAGWSEAREEVVGPEPEPSDRFESCSTWVC